MYYFEERYSPHNHPYRSDVFICHYFSSPQCPMLHILHDLFTKSISIVLASVTIINIDFSTSVECNFCFCIFHVQFFSAPFF